MVPIVYGGANYSSFAPPHSYINVMDFATPKTLAEYLKFLDQNPTEYLSYFWWKDFYRVNWKDKTVKSMCKLCQMLNDDDLESKVYEDMSDWWKKGGKCQQNLPFEFLEEQG